MKSTITILLGIVITFLVIGSHLYIYNLGQINGRNEVCRGICYIIRKHQDDSLLDSNSKDWFMIKAKRINGFKNELELNAILSK